jgi:hypothetical protein
MSSPRITFLAPTGTNYIRLIQRNIISNLRKGNPAQVTLPLIVERAYQVVNETSTIVSSEYPADVVFLERQ